MNDQTIALTVNGRAIRATRGESLAAALLNAGVTEFRSSPSGTPRAPVCGMGVCYECRVTIDGVRHQRACLIAALPGMNVTTGSSS